MSQYKWSNVPEEMYSQVKHLLQGVRRILGKDFVGIYLHGSLPMGCFNPAHSDIDMLVVAQTTMTIYQKYTLADLLLSISATPSPIEISFLTQEQLTPWQHPTPYDFHFSEAHRSHFVQSLADESWRSWNDSTATDGDLAGHITVLNQRGICVYGEQIEHIFPQVPATDYAASIVADFFWAQDYLEENPTYFVLNTCRVLAFLQEERILSKDEGGVWGLDHLSFAHHGLINQALVNYRGVHSDGAIHVQELDDFRKDCTQMVNQLYKSQ